MGILSRSRSEFKTHLFSYRFNGEEWSLAIPARSPWEAKERIKSLGLARYDGELKARVPILPGSLARLASRLGIVRRDK